MNESSGTNFKNLSFRLVIDVNVEKIFALPGMGRQILDAINKREYATVQSSVMIFAILFVTINLVTDIIYRRIDPRINWQ